jgi:lysophospholipase L1-like esterase
MDKVFEFFEQNMRREQDEKLDRFRILNQEARKGEILFTGSSLMEQFPIHELMMNDGMDLVIYNRGIGGFTTRDMMEHMEEMVFGTEPSRIFINIGTNDMNAPDFSQDRLLENYEAILRQIQERLPAAEINVMAYYPVNEVDKVPDGPWGKTLFVNRTNRTIDRLNQALEKLAEKLGCRFINVNKGLTDENGRLKKEYTIEGVHMYANGYRVVLDNLKACL